MNLDIPGIAEKQSIYEALENNARITIRSNFSMMIMTKILKMMEKMMTPLLL